MNVPSRRRRLLNRARAWVIGAGAGVASLLPARVAGVDRRIVVETWTPSPTASTTRLSSRAQPVNV